jgi:hypothetical protein
MKMTFKEIEDLAEDALNAACLIVQDRIGQDDGGIASQVFSGNQVHDLFVAYIKTELAWMEVE